MVAVVGKDPGAVKRVTCHECASILEYTLSEVQKEFSTDYTGSRDEYRYVKCPACFNEVRVKGY